MLTPAILRCLHNVPPSDLVPLLCGDLYCRLCLNECFDSAAWNEATFPPSCAHGPIEFNNVKGSLFRAISELYELKAEEWSTPNRTYCYEPACSQWIPPSNIQDRKATCLLCAKVTCVYCKAKSHEDECPDDPAIKDFKALAKQEGYRQCSQCGRMIERRAGCNHIT